MTTDARLLDYAKEVAAYRFLPLDIAIACIVEDADETAYDCMCHPEDVRDWAARVRAGGES